MLTEARTRPDLVEHAAEQLISATYTGFAEWLRERAGLTAERAEAIAIVGFGALISSRLLRLLLGRDPVPIDDNLFVSTWVQMVHAQIAASTPPRPRARRPAGLGAGSIGVGGGAARPVRGDGESARLSAGTEAVIPDREH